MPSASILLTGEKKDLALWQYRDGVPGIVEELLVIRMQFLKTVSF